MYKSVILSAIRSELEKKLHRLSYKLVKAAQKVYDEWEQQDGFDEVYGSGGICQDIAEAFCDVLFDHNINRTTFNASIGTNHVWAIVYDDEEETAYDVDIPPHVYETGGGYTW